MPAGPFARHSRSLASGQLDTSHAIQIAGGLAGVLGVLDEIASHLNLAGQRLPLGLPLTVAGLGAEGIKQVVDVVGLPICLDLVGGCPPRAPSMLARWKAAEFGEEVARRIGLKLVNGWLSAEQQQGRCGGCSGGCVGSLFAF